MQDNQMNRITIISIPVHSPPSHLMAVIWMNRTNIILWGAVIATLCAMCAAGCTDYGGPGGASEGETFPGYTDMTAEEASSFAVKASTLVVDVSPVWAEEHIPGAVSMPLATLEEELANLGRDREYLIYCHSDSASIRGAETFVANGFSPVYRLDGNYAAWTAAGYPVEMPEYMNVTPEQAKTAIDATGSRIVIVDVSSMYLEGHISGAVSLPLATLETELMTMDKSRSYLIYCHTDVASISGAQAFVNAGFNPVHRLEGNYAAWVDAGYPVTVGKEI